MRLRFSTGISSPILLHFLLLLIRVMLKLPGNYWSEFCLIFSYHLFYHFASASCWSVLPFQIVLVEFPCFTRFIRFVFLFSLLGWFFIH